MKKVILFCLLFMGIITVSCNKNQSQKTDQNKKLTEKPISVQCYKSIYESDTIDLKINILKAGEISGNMQMKLLDLPIKVGKIAGEFRGDTLFVDYTFTQGTNEKVVFKNPMAFLKNGKELILGNGKIESYLGASYFAKGEPIDFENVKYKFSSVDCKK